jgi:hypothetical protein
VIYLIYWDVFCICLSFRAGELSAQRKIVSDSDCVVFGESRDRYTFSPDFYIFYLFHFDFFSLSFISYVSTLHKQSCLFCLYDFGFVLPA